MNLTQAVITAVLGVLAAYRGALTHTNRLRGIIRSNLELLDALPADHPSRATLTTHVGELVDALTSREIRQFKPSSALGMRVDLYRFQAVFWALGFVLMLSLMLETPPESDRFPAWTGLAVFPAITAVFAALASRARWRSLGA